MADAADAEDAGATKGSKRLLFVSLFLALSGAISGFYIAFSGMLPFDAAVKDATGSDKAEKPEKAVVELGDVAFVPLRPLVISPSGSDAGQHLRFQAQLEVPSAYKAEVTRLMPRVVDVLNSYLRALEVQDLEDNSALVRLRAQMLRRVQIVTGPERVRDLLIMEFVLN
ncbi:flagellar basal body-associated FliL family protein [Roseovarius salinarum]|uniref:flagellar basal body-associated FliL family protein n=1 Tax=Roseovarius salinarum TaxID=1981892 RepID=UPI000C32A2D3|nr:flagellar basal body-associated FliL family protein [Roseovarius salinarum]